MRIRHFTRLTAVVATTAALALSAPAAQAALPDPAAPVVTNDSVELYPFGSASVDVLANDTDPGDPDGSALAVCRLPDPDLGAITSPSDLPSVMAVDGAGLLGPQGSLYVMALKGKLNKPAEIDYYVCNYTNLSPATLTVTMRETKPVAVHKVRGMPGRLTVSNHNDSRIILITSGKDDMEELSDVLRVPAHGSRTFKASDKTVRWIAIIGNQRSSGIAGHGVVRNVKVDPTQTSKPGKGDLGKLPGIFRDLIKRVR